MATGNEISPLSVVFVTGNWVEAHMIACALDGHDIPSLVLDDNICRLVWSVTLLVGGIKVVVDQADAESALDVIGLGFSRNPPYVGGWAPFSMEAVLLALVLRRRRLKEPLPEPE